MIKKWALWVPLFSLSACSTRDGDPMAFASACGYAAREKIKTGSIDYRADINSESNLIFSATSVNIDCEICSNYVYENHDRKPQSLGVYAIRGKILCVDPSRKFKIDGMVLVYPKITLSGHEWTKVPANFSPAELERLHVGAD